ncbi:MAG: hypothetical protein HZB54_06475 [Deltaproteobacteria bacterium]|nr:hypothetical protein [Deltaproteobacteria bacterium]
MQKNTRTGSEIKPKREFNDYAPIVENGLFAPADKFSFLDTSTSKDVLPSQENSAERTIALIGTVVSQLGKSYAIFEEIGSKRQEVFKKNAPVFDIGILKEVEKDKAYILADARKISFSMPLEAVDGGRKTTDSILPNQASQTPVISQKISEKEWLIDQRALSKTLEDMSKILTDGRLLPYKEGDKIVGFRVSEIKPEGVFNLIGLKNGDILLSVNNYKIDSPEKGVQLLTGLKGESSISLDIIRGGQKMNMKYQIR